MVQELNFTKIEGGHGYEAFAAVGNDFNIHLERINTGSVTLYQSTVEDGKKAIQFHLSSAGDVWEEDFDNIVYPKFLRIVSSSMVRKGYITERED